MEKDNVFFAIPMDERQLGLLELIYFHSHGV